MLPRLAPWLPSWFPSTYGILVALGFLAGLWLTLRLSRRTEVDRNQVMDVAIWGLICGLLGAKLGMIVIDLPTYLQDPAEILGTLRYAGVFYAGLAASLLFLFLYARRQELAFLELTDLFAPGLALAHAFGRFGCFLAGCCWGTACRLPWAVTYTDPHTKQTVGTPLGLRLHPVQLYEAFLELGLCVLLLLLWRKRPRLGAITAIYALLYAAGRFGLEFLRADPRGSLGPFSTSQWFALGAVVIVSLGMAIWGLGARRLHREKDPRG